MRIETRGPKEGVCNICGTYGPLTEDHTPPKGSIRVSQVEMRHITGLLSTGKADREFRLSQNGVKYRTLCARCNNTLLGANYDPAFIDFTSQIGAFLKSSLALPPTMNVKAKPQKIMRSVLGHISAQGVDRYKKGPNTEPLRDYILDPSAPLPAAINIYYWIYPFQRQVLVRDCALSDLKVGQPVVIWLMKFFPVTFMVTWNEPAGYAFRVPILSTHRTLGINGEVELPIPLRPIVHEFWPQAPTQYSFLLYGQEAIWAIGRPA
ncbi:MAG: hypothetical protein NUV55_01230 [Sulfuricaulis sp.]|uniref:hypothetical protein n=1 Tax=Sulfuricaulis sp. TaxID=2003553 RepID=UPI0025DFABB5|nr:hypothetical protein [Sulfuricaulis sp.]MCR4345817.1 hypothetical protein [Sulfuricaulis sp.]